MVEIVNSPARPTVEDMGKLPCPIDDKDKGVYMCLISGPTPEHGVHAYIGSATGTDGMEGRIKQHLDPASLKTHPDSQAQHGG